MKTRALTFGTAIAAGLLAGYLFRAAVLEGVAQDPSVAGGDASPGSATGAGSGGLRSVALRSSEREREKTHLVDAPGVTRWLHWVASLESATLDDMVRLAEFTGGKRMAQEMLVARWMELDPRHLFETVAGGSADADIPAGNLRWLMLNDWARSDLYALVETLRTSDAPGIHSMRSNIVSRVIDQDAELGLELFHEWGIRSHRPHMKGVEKWARKDPRHAAEFLLARPSGIVTETAAKTVGKIWGETDPESALAFALGSGRNHSQEIADEALSAWAKKDFAAAAEWLGAADASTHSRVAASFVAAWAESDPAAALQWADANLTGRPLADATAGTVRSLVEKDHAGAARLVSELEPSDAKTAAAVEVAKKWMPDWNSTEPLPTEATDWMLGLDQASLARVLDRAWGWMRSDRVGFAEFLTRPEAASVSASTIHRAARDLVRHDPEAAIDWATRLPEDKVGPAAREVFNRWHQSQPEAARAWLDAVPEAAGERDALARRAARSFLDGEPSGSPFTD